MTFIFKQYKKLWNLWFNILGWSYNPLKMCRIKSCNYIDEERSMDSFSPTENQIFTFDINDYNEDDNDTENPKELHIIYKTCKVLYTILIWSILGLRPIIYVYNNNNDSFDQVVSRISFEIIPLLIHFFGISYFNSNHFEYHRNKENTLINNNIILCSFIFSSGSVIIQIYNQENTNLLLFNSIYIFYTVNILTTYLFIFNTIFCHHKINVRTIENNINNESIDSISIISINKIIIEIQNFKRGLNKSVTSYENMFNSTTICGGIGCSLIINRWLSINGTTKHVHLKPSMIIFISIFWFIQLIFYINASSVYRFQEKISDSLNNSYFTQTCLKRETTLRSRQRFTFDRIVIKYLENLSTTIDWIVLHYILNQKVCHFKVLGIPLHRWQTFERMIILFAFVGIIHNSN